MGNTRKWVGGLISAIASGAGGALAVHIVDPADFNLEDPGKLLAVAGAFAVVAVLNFLKEHPLPEVPK